MPQRTNMFAGRPAWMLALLLSLAPMRLAHAAEVTYALRITNGRVPEDMRLIRVKQNDVVKLEWSTDKPITVHLHGYDIEREVKPGAVTEMAFTARATGRFTVEPHIGRTSSGAHAHGETLVTIEVYP
jgi:hypothetical protein